ncbi:MAG: hypothetical protein MHPSP_001700 [Paramarteilia canceri]
MEDRKYDEEFRAFINRTIVNLVESSIKLLSVESSNRKSYTDAETKIEMVHYTITSQIENNVIEAPVDIKSKHCLALLDLLKLANIDKNKSLSTEVKVEKIMPILISWFEKNKELTEDIFFNMVAFRIVNYLKSSLSYNYDIMSYIGRISYFFDNEIEIKHDFLQILIGESSLTSLFPPDIDVKKKLERINDLIDKYNQTVWKSFLIQFCISSIDLIVKEDFYRPFTKNARLIGHVNRMIEKNNEYKENSNDETEKENLEIFNLIIEGLYLSSLNDLGRLNDRISLFLCKISSKYYFFKENAYYKGLIISMLKWIVLVSTPTKKNSIRQYINSLEEI